MYHKLKLVCLISSLLFYFNVFMSHILWILHTRLCIHALVINIHIWFVWNAEVEMSALNVRFSCDTVADTV